MYIVVGMEEARDSSRVNSIISIVTVVWWYKLNEMLRVSFGSSGSAPVPLVVCQMRQRDRVHNGCNDPTIGSYNHYHLNPNCIPSGIQRWYGLVYIIHMAGNPRIRPRE